MGFRRKVHRVREGAFWFRFLIGGIVMILFGPFYAVQEDTVHGILFVVGGILAVGVGWTGYRRAHTQWRREDKPRRRRRVVHQSFEEDEDLGDTQPYEEQDDLANALDNMRK